MTVLLRQENYKTGDNDQQWLNVAAYRTLVMTPIPMTVLRELDAIRLVPRV